MARPLLASCVLVLGLAAFLPAAEAQQPTGTITLSAKIGQPDLVNGRIRPGDVAVIPIDVTVRFGGPLAGCLAPIPIQYTLSSVPSYATAVLHPASDSVEPSQTGGFDGSLNPYMATKRVTIEVSVAPSAPAMVQGMYKIHVDVVPPPWTNGCNLAPARLDTMFTIQNDYVPSFRVEPAFSLSDHSTGTIPVTVENLGNGPARVTVRFQPVNEDAFAALAAQDVRLESRATYGLGAVTKIDLPIVYQTALAGPQLFTATFVDSYDGPMGGGEPTAETAMNFTVGSDTAGAGPDPASNSEDSVPPALPTPSLEPSVLIAAVAGLAMVLMRRRAT